MNEREANVLVNPRESTLYNTRRSTCFLRASSRKVSPRCSFCRVSDGLRVHEAINIITERERVGIIIADDGKKNDDRKGRETRKRIGKAHVAFVTRGTAAITCQLWGTVCSVCLSLKRESTEGGLRPERRSGG